MRFDLVFERLRLLSPIGRRRENELVHFHFTRTHGLPPPRLENSTRHFRGEAKLVGGATRAKGPTRRIAHLRKSSSSRGHVLTLFGVIMGCTNGLTIRLFVCLRR